jgi:hypothetical protein
MADCCGSDHQTQARIASSLACAHLGQPPPNNALQLTKPAQAMELRS